MLSAKFSNNESEVDEDAVSVGSLLDASFSSCESMDLQKQNHLIDDKIETSLQSLIDSKMDAKISFSNSLAALDLKKENGAKHLYEIRRQHQEDYLSLSQ